MGLGSHSCLAVASGEDATASLTIDPSFSEANEGVLGGMSAVGDCDGLRALNGDCSRNPLNPDTDFELPIDGIALRGPDSLERVGDGLGEREDPFGVSELDSRRYEVRT